MSRIRVLPDALASRIAAGEVVERPSSVVKELVENALDAGARLVRIDLEAGGRSLVRVTDDGCGMDRDDALMAFEQHATSKVHGDDDVFGAATRGFRGEALPAIAAVARVTLTTAESAGEGTRVRFELGRLRDVSAVGAPRGTSVEVRDLFAELPARRKFLRSAQSELAHAVRHAEQLALASPEVHVVLAHEGRQLLEALPARQDARVRQVLGSAAEEATVVDEERAGVRVQAWLLGADRGAGRGAGLTLLVNGRAVSDRLLSHAVREAAGRLFASDAAPAGVVMLTLDARAVDVNVHPAKREVRFQRPSEIHDAVRDAIVSGAAARGRFAPVLPASSPGAVAEPRGAWEPALLPIGAVPPAEAAEAASSACEGRARAVSPASPIGAGRRILGQHRNTYVVAEDEQGLLLVDQHCAHERILYEQFLGRLGAQSASQALLEPVVVELPRAAAERLRDRLEDLARLGFEVEPFGGEAFAVRAVPAAVASESPAELLRELAAQEEPGPVERVQRMAATMACKAAVKASFPLSHERMRWLVDELLACDVPTTCPHGRIAILRLGDRDLDHRFQRI